MNEWLKGLVKEGGMIANAIKLMYQVLAAMYWIWSNLVTKILIPFQYIGGGIWNVWVKLWNKVVHRKDGDFSYSRAGVLLAATLAFIYMLPTFLLLTWQTTFYFVTGGVDTVYLTQSQEIYPDDDIHSVKGCTSLPCSDQVAVYYRVAPTLFNQMWSLVVQQDIFMPDNVAAAVPPGLSECKVHAYGLRLKFLMKKMDIYPDAIEILCEPIKSH